MGKLTEIIKKRKRWQNISKVHQVIYDEKGLAINVCVGAMISPQTDEAEKWWEEKLKTNPFFDVVGLVPPHTASELKPVPQIGFPGFGSVQKPGAEKDSNAKLKLSVAQEGSSRGFTPDRKPTEAKGGMGLKAEIDGAIQTPGNNEEKIGSTVVERPKPQNLNIPQGTEEIVTTGKTGKTRRGRKSKNPSAINTPVVGQGIINQTGGDSNG